MSMRKINGRMDAFRRYLRNVTRKADPSWMKQRRNEWFATQSACKRAAKAAV